MKQIELYIPLTDNNSNRPNDYRWRELENSLLGYFEGFSTYSVSGQWLYPDGNENYGDRCRVYRIVCDGTEAHLRWIKAIAVYVKEHWKQESVLYTISDVDAVFV